MLKRYRRVIVSMLLLASTINCVDHAAFSVAAFSVPRRSLGIDSEIGNENPMPN